MVPAPVVLQGVDGLLQVHQGPTQEDFEVEGRRDAQEDLFVGHDPCKDPLVAHQRPAERLVLADEALQVLGVGRVRRRFADHEVQVRL